MFGIDVRADFQDEHHRITWHGVWWLDSMAVLDTVPGCPVLNQLEFICCQCAENVVHDPLPCNTRK
jgi:hypothetical protein